MRKYGKQTLLLLVAVLTLALTGCGRMMRPEERVMPLTCLHPASIPGLLALEEGRILSCWADYEGNITHLDIVNVLRDEVETSITVEGAMELAQDMPADGKAVLRSQADDLLHLWDGASAQMDTVTIPTPSGILSHDGQTYYYIDRQVLCAMDISTGDASPVSLAQPLRFAGITGSNPDSGELVLSVYTDPFTLSVGTAVVNPASGEISLLQNGMSDVAFCGEMMALVGFDTQTMAPYAIFSAPDAPGRCCRMSTPAAPGGEPEWYIPPRSSYLLQLAYTGSGEVTTLCRLGQAVQACVLSDCGLDGALRGCVYLAAETLIVGSVYEDGQCTLYVLDPPALPFTALDAVETVDFTPVDEGVVQGYFDALAGTPVTPALEAVRHQADTLEQRHGVRIFISSQCSALCRCSGRDVTTSDQAGLANETADIARTLDALDQRLAQYPEGFFRQFSNACGDGGVCFLLTGSVNDDRGTVGFTFEAGLFQCIALDITLGDAGGTICHEIWHATENRITGRDSTVFDEMSWSAYNPDGFSYYYNYPGQPESGRWTLYGITGEAVYFVDDYARTDSHEDRARIMEYIMMDDFTARAVMDVPVLREKLQVMCEAVRTHFDTNTWDNVRWERYF